MPLFGFRVLLRSRCPNAAPTAPADVVHDKCDGIAMVTLPTEAASDAGFAEAIIRAGAGEKYPAAATPIVAGVIQRRGERGALIAHAQAHRLIEPPD